MARAWPISDCSDAEGRSAGHSDEIAPGVPVAIAYECSVKMARIRSLTMSGR